MTRMQYDVMAIVAADLCERYKIPVTEQTVLGHGKVQQILGVPQNGKWDPMVLPWEPGKSASSVGDAFGAQVQAVLNGGVPANPVEGESNDHLAPIKVRLDGAQLSDEGVLKGGSSRCPLRVLADKQGWTIVDIDADSAILDTPTSRIEVVAMIRGDRGTVQIKDLAGKLKWPKPRWNDSTRTVAITTR